jgi:hypothetical protein
MKASKVAIRRACGGTTTNHWQGSGGNGDNEQEVRMFDLDYSQWHTYALE